MSPPQPRRRSPMFITMVHSTSDSSARCNHRQDWAQEDYFYAAILGVHIL